MRLYVSGHSKQRSFTTFVPDGVTVSMYADDGYMLPDSEALAILRTGSGEVRYRRTSGQTITNYRLTELDGLELARETAVKGYKTEGSPFPGEVKVVGAELESPVLLCTAPDSCDPAKRVHACNGLLGSLGKGYDELHLVVCRGEAKDYTPYERDAAHDAKVNAFLELGAPERAAAWADLPEPDRAALISTDGMLRWFEATNIEYFAAKRPGSLFARHRVFLALPKDICELLEDDTDDDYVTGVMETVRAERAAYDALADQVKRNAYTLAAWKALSANSQQDAAAVDSREDHRYGPLARWILATPGATLGARNATDAQIRAQSASVLASIVGQYKDQLHADEVPLSCVVLNNVALLGSDPSWLPVAIDLKHRGGLLLDPDPLLVVDPEKDTLPAFTFDALPAPLADEVRAIAAGTSAYTVKFA